MARLPAVVDLTAYRGDTWSQSFRFVSNVEPLDLSGKTIEATARHRMRAQTVAFVVSTGPDPGVVTLELPADIYPGSYKYDVEITDSEGVVKTWIRGDLQVERDVTNAL